MTTLRSRLPVALAAVFLSMLAYAVTGNALVEVSQTSGNEAKTENPRWPKGLLEVVNLESRVYATEWRGFGGVDEHFYYRGDAQALNEALRKFAGIGTDLREVVIRPGPGEAKALEPGRRVQCDWQVDFPSSLMREGGSFSNDPVMRVYATAGLVELDQVQMPAGLTVLELRDLLDRHVAALKSEDSGARYRGAYRLGEMVALSEYAIPPLMDALKDESEGVRRQAAASLSRFGTRAIVALPRLREALEQASGASKEALEQAVAAIEDSEDEEVKAQRSTCRRIGKFRESLRKESQD